MLPLKQCAKMLLRQWCKKLLLLSFLCLAVYVSIQLWKSPAKVRSSNQIASSSEQKMTVTSIVSDYQNDFGLHTLQRQEMTEVEMCPVCFGGDLCSEFDKHFLKIDIDSHGERSGKIFRKGILHENDKVILNSVTADEWTRLDEFICRNASMSVPCNVASAYKLGYLAEKRALSVENIWNLHQVLDKARSEVALPVCATAKLVEALQQTFDEDGDGHFSTEEQVMLLTSLLLNPGYVAMKFQVKANINMPIVSVRGACGRMAITEAGFHMLKDYLHESFDMRAGLAVQVLQIVEDFEDEDPHWYFLYTEFSHENLAVTKDGEVIVTDLQDVIILDKMLFPSDIKALEPNFELCNEVCFQKFTREILLGQNTTSVCSEASQYSELMYAIVCKQVFSNIDEHRTEGFFNFDGNRVHKKSQYLGLLHSIPGRDRENIEDLLRECVQETTPGGRKRAVEELREILEGYANQDDDVDDKFDDGGADDSPLHSPQRSKGHEDEDYNDIEDTDDYMDSENY